MSSELLEKIGFTADDAIIFGQKILSRYERLLNERRRNASEVLKENMSNLKILKKAMNCVNSLNNNK